MRQRRSNIQSSLHFQDDQIKMPKAPRAKRMVATPYQRETEAQMETAEYREIEYKPSPLSKLSSSSKARRAHLKPEDPSPYDGMTQEESEEALLNAIIPNLPKKGLSVRFFAVSALSSSNSKNSHSNTWNYIQAPSKNASRGALIRQQKLEARELRDTIRKLKESRMRAGSSVQAKGHKKSITQEIKNLEDELEAKHAKELADFDAQHGTSSDPSHRQTEGKINFKSINLDFSHIKFTSSAP